MNAPTVKRTPAEDCNLEGPTFIGRSRTSGTKQCTPIENGKADRLDNGKVHSSSSGDFYGTVGLLLALLFGDANAAKGRTIAHEAGPARQRRMIEIQILRCKEQFLIMIAAAFGIPRYHLRRRPDCQ